MSNRYFNRGSDRDYGRMNRYNSEPWRNKDYQTGYNGDYGFTDYNSGYEYPDDFYNENLTPTYTFYEEDWYIPGPYTGRGPQDYQRSDERIREDINERLTQHGRLDASQIHVDVKDGEVTLTGTVPDRHQKRMAEDTADSVSGVKDIHNQLHVEHQQQSQGQKQGQAQQHRQSQSQTQRQTQGRSQTQSQTRSRGGQDLRSQIRGGMEVIDSNNQTVGKVAGVRDQDFQLDLHGHEDIFVPFSHAHVTNGRVQLDIPKDQVTRQGWATEPTGVQHR